MIVSTALRTSNKSLLATEAHIERLMSTFLEDHEKRTTPAIHQDHFAEIDVTRLSFEEDEVVWLIH